MATGKRAPHARNRKDILYAEQMGWRYVTTSGRNHLVFEHPGTRAKLRLPGTPSEYRSCANDIANIRRLTPRERSSDEQA